MDDRFLHEGEMLLSSRHATAAVLIASLVRGLLDALIAGGILDLLLLVLAMATSSVFSLWLYVVLPVLVYIVIVVLRYRVWKHATFRITTERILVAEPMHLFHAPLHTVKWSQYQESFTGHRSFLDFLFFARSLHIRHGTADAQREVEFPSLCYADDLKHYLDKIDSSVRKGESADLKPFVAKPRGKRDA